MVKKSFFQVDSMFVFAKQKRRNQNEIITVCVPRHVPLSCSTDHYHSPL